jgi:hypothetical protein
MLDFAAWLACNGMHAALNPRILLCNLSEPVPSGNLKRAEQSARFSLRAQRWRRLAQTFIISQHL